MNRFAYLLLVVVSLGAMSAPLAAASEKLAYDINRNGETIGRLTVLFSGNDAANRTVTSETRVVVKIAFVPVYRYSKDVSETYENGRLVRLDVSVDDNGAKTAFTGRIEGDEMVINAGDAIYRHPAGRMVSSYWDPNTVNQSAMIDSSVGDQDNVTVKNLGRKSLEIGGRTVMANHYRLTGDIERELWYADGELVRTLDIARDGSTVTNDRNWNPDAPQKKRGL